MRIWVCFSGVAVVGYAAVKVWRKVQVERPSSSTSGGQSVWVEGGGAGMEVVDDVVVVAAAPAPAAMPPDVEACLSIARQEAADVHVLHLNVYVSLMLPVATSL